jgi:unsaturated chondroitin disaccharide hydrolase
VIRIDDALKPADLVPRIRRLWELSAGKIRSIEKSCPPDKASPVFTVRGQYTARGWTEWTRGFQYGSAILQFDATSEKEFLELGRDRTLHAMASHLTHMGVHDHGFNNVSTYGNLWRLLREGRLPENPWERHFYELALKVSGAVQARRWTKIRDGGGFIHSFNGPHSLFADTIRSLRSLALAHLLGHVLMEEGDRPVSILERFSEHARATARYSVYYGEGRDAYDVPGRVAHESVFNVQDGGAYRCPNSQQGYSPFSTWTRGLAWIMLGAAEQLESLPLMGPVGDLAAVLEKAARATCDFYIAQTPADGVPYWDTGAPGLSKMGDYLSRPADPFNDHEPVDSSAAAIAAQGLLRLGRHLNQARYVQAGLATLRTLLGETYLSADPAHQGLLLHSVYHRPNGWDHVAPGSRVPRGESSMWGDYHLREAALYVERLANNGPYLAFTGGLP